MSSDAPKSPIVLMDPPSGFMPRWMLSVFSVLWMGFSCVMWFPYAMVLLAFGGGSGTMKFIQTTWSRAMLWVPGARLEIYGSENLDKNRTTIFATNHQSTLDIPALMAAVWPTEIRFVAKNVIKYVPLFGWYMWMAGYVFIDRANRKAGLESLKRAAKQIHDGTSIIIFPEGTRSETGEILPFKKGTFVLATLAEVPICPIAIEGTRQIMPKARWTITPGTIKVNIGAPIDPKPFGKDREALTRHVRDALIDLHKQIGGPGGDKSVASAREKAEA